MDHDFVLPVRPSTTHDTRYLLGRNHHADEKFNDILTGLLATARAGGVDVNGSWQCRNDQGKTNWEVNIVKLLVEEFDEG